MIELQQYTPLENGMILVRRGNWYKKEQVDACLAAANKRIQELEAQVKAMRTCDNCNYFESRDCPKDCNIVCEDWKMTI